MKKSKQSAPSARQIKSMLITAEVERMMDGETVVSEESYRKLRARAAARLKRPVSQRELIERFEAEQVAKLIADGGVLTSTPPPGSLLARPFKASRKVRIHAAAVGREVSDWPPPFPEAPQAE